MARKGMGNVDVSYNSQDITALIADRLVGMTITDEAGLQSDRVTIERDPRVPPPSDERGPSSPDRVETGDDPT